MEANFFAIEGQDGSGKGTQFEMLKKRLRKEGRGVRTVDLPQYGKPCAKLVEDYLHGKYGPIEKVSPYQASTFFAFDRFGASRQVKKWLKDGYVVLANRWVASNLGHQGTKVPPRKLDQFFDWLIDFEYNILEAPEPLTIILHVPARVSFKLVHERSRRTGRKRDKHELSLSHLQRAERIYKRMPKWWPEEDKLVECYVENRLLSPEEIHEKVWEILKPRLKKA